MSIKQKGGKNTNLQSGDCAYKSTHSIIFLRIEMKFVIIGRNFECVKILLLTGVLNVYDLKVL